jgi:Ni,Fe-hydrogenase III large subunit
MTQDIKTLKNGGTTDLSDIATISVDSFRQQVIAAIESHKRLSAMFARPVGDKYQLFAILTDDKEGCAAILSTEVEEGYTSITPQCSPAHLFEREIYEQWGIVPEGHPWLKPVRFPPPEPEGQKSLKVERPTIGTADFYRVEGEEIHEVAVGPVHAGVIEPGHFRFQCHGEIVFSLEISLGYQHRGVERAIKGGPDKRTLHYMETLSGDTSIGHATAYCQNIEALGGCVVPPKARMLRSIMLELERAACHIGDMGALAADVGYLPTSSFCGAIRGDVLNITAMVCGNRFGRDMLVPGGVTWDVDDKLAAEMLPRVEKAYDQAKDAIDLLWQTQSVLVRFEGCGKLSLEACRGMGLVGPAARACGLDIDIRRDLPFAGYADDKIPVSTWHSSDVFARGYIRWLEIEQSLKYVMQQLKAMPGGPISAEVGPLPADKFALSFTEGWRGEICHVAITGPDKKLETYKIVDPSFHNWFGLAMALRDQEISDFPLNNKSFNLSYCGFDL